jgi:hypothetical protein
MAGKPVSVILNEAEGFALFRQAPYQMFSAQHTGIAVSNLAGAVR